jgi:hypothetical protein
MSSYELQRLSFELMASSSKLLASPSNQLATAYSFILWAIWVSFRANLITSWAIGIIVWATASSTDFLGSPSNLLTTTELMVILFATSWWQKPLVVLAQLYHQIWKYWPVFNVKYQSDNQKVAPQHFFLAQMTILLAHLFITPTMTTVLRRKGTQIYSNLVPICLKDYISNSNIG